MVGAIFASGCRVVVTNLLGRLPYLMVKWGFIYVSVVLDEDEHRRRVLSRSKSSSPLDWKTVSRWRADHLRTITNKPVFGIFKDFKEVERRLFTLTDKLWVIPGMGVKGNGMIDIFARGTLALLARHNVDLTPTVLSVFDGKTFGVNLTTKPSYANKFVPFTVWLGILNLNLKTLDLVDNWGGGIGKFVDYYVEFNLPTIIDTSFQHILYSWTEMVRYPTRYFRQTQSFSLDAMDMVRRRALLGAGGHPIVDHDVHGYVRLDHNGLISATGDRVQFISISGHLISGLLISESLPFSVGLFIDMVEGGLNHLQNPAPWHKMRKAGLLVEVVEPNPTLWHNYYEYSLAIDAYGALARGYVSVDENMIMHLRMELLRLKNWYKVFSCESRNAVKARTRGLTVNSAEDCV
jgi:hypothetical protein